MIVFVLLIFFFVNSVKGDLDGNCDLKGVSENEWQSAFKNDEREDDSTEPFIIFETANVLSVDVEVGPFSKYFLVNYGNDVLTVGPSDDFSTYETNEVHDPKPTMTIKLQFNCSSGKRSLSFYQPIKDFNTYNPFFLQPSYTFLLPTPLPGDINLQCLTGISVEACDWDITNMDLTFEVDPPGDFEMVSDGPTNQTNNCFTTVIKTINPLDLTKNKNYELKVTDQGNKPRSGTAKMEIEINEETAVPSNPQFSSPYYEADYDDTSDPHQVNFKITLEKTYEDLELKLIGVQGSNFYIEHKDDTVTITLTKNLLPEVISENVVVLLTVEVKIPNTDISGRTVLVIYMPPKECPTTTTSIPTTACPTTQTTTECPICTTEGTSIVTCPPCSTEQQTTSECPVCSTETTTIYTCPTEPSITTTNCPTAATSTECPVCTTDVTTLTCPPCTDTSPTFPTESTCPPCTNETTVCPEASVGTESLVTTTCPTTECPICATEASTNCPPHSTDQTISNTDCPTTECPVGTTDVTTLTCPPCTDTPPTIPTECPVNTTESTCPPCTNETTVCPDTSVGTESLVTTTCPTTECPICATEASTNCPPHSTDQTISNTDCPTTDYPVCSTEATCPPCANETMTCPDTSVATKCLTPFTCPTTECPICTTESSETITCPETSIVTDCPCITPPTTSESFTTECSQNTTIISDCPPCTTSNTPSFSECPTVCPPSSSDATSCPTSCPPCTTTIGPPEPYLAFLQDTYKFDAVPTDAVVEVGQVKAKAVPEDKIEYKIETNEGAFQIDKDTGVISLNGKIDPKLYKFTTRARTVTSGIEDTAAVEVNVYIESETAEILIVETINENEQSSIRLPCPNGQSKCTYKYLDQYPPTDNQLFSSEDGNLLVQPINLQLEEIKNLSYPQFSVNLELTNTESAATHKLNQITKDEDRHWLYLPGTIPRNPNTLLVSVIIKDVNNNPPVFDVGSDLTVGYPMKTLLSVLSPPHLVQVHATDLDKNENGDIRYTTEDENFIVHPKTGIVHATENAFENNVNKEFVVVATDLDGQDGGEKATLNVKVVLLSQEHLTYLTVTDTHLEDMEDLLKKLSKETNFQINYFTAVIVPKSEKIFVKYLRKLKPTRENDDYSIKMTIYALDEKNQPVLAKALQETLDEIESFGDLTIAPWSSSCGREEEMTNTTGYVAAIAVLASLLVIFMIVVAVLYYIKIYKKRKSDPYNTMTDEDSGSIKFDKPPIEEDEVKPKKRLTKFVFNPPPPEEYDDDETDNKNYETVPNKGWPSEKVSPIYNDPIDIKVSNETSPSKDLKLEIGENTDSENEESKETANGLDSRKSVSFKPIVEKYNIVLDTDKQDEEDLDVHL